MTALDAGPAPQGNSCSFSRYNVVKDRVHICHDGPRKFDACRGAGSRWAADEMRAAMPIMPSERGRCYIWEQLRYKARTRGGLLGAHDENSRSMASTA